jgi:hypothetical protein
MMRNDDVKLPEIPSSSSLPLYAVAVIPYRFMHENKEKILKSLKLLKIIALIMMLMMMMMLIRQTSTEP